MKIFLDDVRVINEEYGYELVRGYDKCISLLEANKDDIELLSTDYDLSYSRKPDAHKTGYDVLVYMKENNIIPQRINVHSTHKEGVAKMAKYLKKYFANTDITYNEL